MRQTLYNWPKKTERDHRLRRLAKIAYVKIEHKYQEGKPDMARHFLRRSERYVQLWKLTRLCFYANYLAKKKADQGRSDMAQHFVKRTEQYWQLAVELQRKPLPLLRRRENRKP